MAQLATAHDPAHIHKGLGVLVLAHFAYRLGHLAWWGDAFPPIPGFWDYAGLALHAALSLSAFIPPVPPRVMCRPVIWPEFRVHSALFSVRHVAAAALALWARGAGLPPPLARAALTALITGLATYGAAAATEALGSKTDRTTSSMAHPPHLDAETVRRTRRFYSTAQFGATCACGTWAPSHAYVPLYGIQLAPFLMTLVRKGRLGPQLYHLGYFLALLVPYAAACVAGAGSGERTLLQGVGATLAEHFRIRLGGPRWVSCALAAAIAAAAPGPSPSGPSCWEASTSAQRSACTSWGCSEVGALAAWVALAGKAPLLFLYSAPPSPGLWWRACLRGCQKVDYPTPVLLAAALVLRAVLQK